MLRSIIIRPDDKSPTWRSLTAGPHLEACYLKIHTRGFLPEDSYPAVPPEGP